MPVDATAYELYARRARDVTEIGNVSAGLRATQRSPYGATAAAVAALTIGIAVATWYYVHDLTLTHHDAKAHLVVARRVFDSLRPGWKQIGAVWLPLPHLLNLWPVQNEWLYRTGLSAVALSVAGYVLAATSLWWLIARATGSIPAAWAAFIVFALNPNVLYLQATPLTEPILMGLLLFGIARLWHVVACRGACNALPAGAALALACLTRYEAWPATGAALPLAPVALTHLRVSRRLIARRIAETAIVPASSATAFMILSKATVGSWLVTDGFFLREAVNSTAAAGALLGGVAALHGGIIVAASIASAAVIAVRANRIHLHAPLLVVFALAACIALPIYAFSQGHPFRIRYAAPLSIMVSVSIGLGIGLLPRARRAAALVVSILAIGTTLPLSRSPIFLEAQRDVPNSIARRELTACLVERFDGTRSLASMGSLAHYMQELSAPGFHLRDFVHGGTGQLWADGLTSTGGVAGWALIYERNEGRDALVRARERAPDFLAGFMRVCEAAGIGLYRRAAATGSN